MSTSYTATVLYGYPIPLTSERPNPLFGKHRFDPETGAKVTKTITDRVEIDEIVEKHKRKMTKLDYEADSDYTSAVVGFRLASTDVGYGGGIEPFAPLDDDVSAAVHVAIERILTELGLPIESALFGYHLVGKTC